MISKNIDQITKEDLEALIESLVMEGKTIEYKQSLPGNTESEKKEFLADVSSFANASGGDLIFGIVEDKVSGAPALLEGFDIGNIDQEILRLESMIREGIEPRLPAVYTKPIALPNSRTALVVRIPKSWISPHRVSFKGWDKFFSRSSNGKYPLDVSELRIAFNLSEAVSERIRKFREDRISKIIAGETPVPFYENAKIILHLMPISSYELGKSYDIRIIAGDPSKMVPINCSGYSQRYNLDGFLTYSYGEAGKSHSYAQLFRNGIIEAVEGLLLKPGRDEFLIPSVAYEHELIESLDAYISILKMLNVELPIFIFLALTGVKGYSMAIDDMWLSREGNAIDRDVLSLPETVIESYDVRAKDVLRPCFDSIWNACGYAKSMNYNDAGEWKKQ